MGVSGRHFSCQSSMLLFWLMGTGCLRKGIITKKKSHTFITQSQILVRKVSVPNRLYNQRGKEDNLSTVHDSSAAWRETQSTNIHRETKNVGCRDGSVSTGAKPGELSSMSRHHIKVDGENQSSL